MILDAFSFLFEFLGEIFQGFLDILLKPFSFLLALLEGIFYFISVLFQIAVGIIMLFVAMFQYFFLMVAGLLRTIGSWIGFTPSANYNLPSTSKLGFQTTLEQIGGTGLLTVVPTVLIAVLWLYFAIKMVALFGGKGDVK